MIHLQRVLAASAAGSSPSSSPLKPPVPAGGGAAGGTAPQLPPSPQLPQQAPEYGKLKKLVGAYSTYCPPPLSRCVGVGFCS